MGTKKLLNKEKTLEFQPFNLVELEGFKIKMTPKHKLYRKGMTEEELEGGFVITPDNICPNSWINKGIQVIDGAKLDYSRFSRDTEIRIVDSVIEGRVSIINKPYEIINSMIVGGVYGSNNYGVGDKIKDKSLIWKEN